MRHFREDTVLHVGSRRLDNMSLSSITRTQKLPERQQCLTGDIMQRVQLRYGASNGSFSPTCHSALPTRLQPIDSRVAEFNLLL